MRSLPLALSVALLLAQTPVLPAQQAAADPGITPCISQGGSQHCSVQSLQHAMATATSIAVDSGPRDRAGAGQLRSFVTSLGKSVALNEESADLALRISPIEQVGVNYGAADRELARLNVYAPVGPAKRQQLIWEETLSGPADLSWPAAVSRLIEQFKHRAAAR